jgi:hypothetical protein
MSQYVHMSSSKFFNMINQGQPLFIADIRSLDSFQKCRIRNSHSFTIESSSGEIVLDYFRQSIEKNSVRVVCIFDESTPSGAIEQLVPLITSIGGSKVLSIDHVDFDVFFRAYPRSAFLYLGTDFPKQDTKLPKKEYPTDVIDQFMYLGNFYDATDEGILKHLLITHIVDATGEKLSKAAATKLGIAYLPVKLWDIEGADITQYFDQVIAFIELAKSYKPLSPEVDQSTETGTTTSDSGTQINSTIGGGSGSKGCILIHCRAGISRSSTFVLAYLLWARLEPSLRSAVRRVVTERPFVLPNPSFRDQLRAYELALLGSASFADDAEMLEFISSFNYCWSGMFTSESDFDRIPIVYAMQGKKNAISPLDEYPPEGAADNSQSSSAKPKKPFLKRGAGGVGSKKAAVSAPALQG